MRVIETFDKKRAGLLRIFCPDVHVQSVTDIHTSSLVEHGIRYLLLDLDNTLTPWRSREVPTAVREWIDELKNIGIGLCIVSNTRNISRLVTLAKELDIGYVRERMKPSRRGYVSAMKLLGAKPDEVAMAGDQLFTDIWGGNRMGMMTIWVEPMHKKEFFGTKLSRTAERFILWILRLLGARKATETTG